MQVITRSKIFSVSSLEEFRFIALTEFRRWNLGPIPAGSIISPSLLRPPFGLRLTEVAVSFHIPLDHLSARMTFAEYWYGDVMERKYTTSTDFHGKACIPPLN